MLKQPLHSIHNKEFWTEFFYLYESLPALWDLSNPLYKNRQVKSDAYEVMVEKLREIEPNADREDVLRKINIFRTNFRRECSRINMSLKEGRPYHSTLWYFDLLCFLQTTDTRRDKPRRTDFDGEKTIMRKRSSNVKRKSTDQYITASKKNNLIQYQPHSIHEFEYEPEEDSNFDYVPDEVSHVLVDYKNDVSSEGEDIDIGESNYRAAKEENEDDDQSQQEYNHQGELQNYSLQRNVQTNKKMKVSVDNTSQHSDEISAKENPLEINETEEQQTFEEFAGDNDNETLTTAQWSTKSPIGQHISTPQLRKEINTSKTKAKVIKVIDSAATKFVRDVKTMTFNNSHGNCCSKLLSESSEILAKSWAVQYAELSQSQQVLARKAINDILFNGCMGYLAMGSNGHVTTVNRTDHKNRRTAKVTSNEDVESSEIYEQSINITTSSTS